MLDIKKIKQDPGHYEQKLKSKDPSIQLGPVLEAYETFCRTTEELQGLQSQMNEAARLIGEKKRKGEDAGERIQELGKLKGAISELSAKLKDAEQFYIDLLSRLPNLPQEGIKEALDPKENECIKEVGTKPHFDFPFKNHVELNEKLELFDFERGAKISGSGWPIYKNYGALLEWALIQYMLQIHLRNGFEFWLVPHLVQSHIMYGSGQLPKFQDQSYKITDKDYQLYLLPTSEVALNGLHFDEIFAEEDLPKKYVSYTPCFRREAGALGANERGLIRIHQFNKVEMFSFCKPDQSEQIFEEMISSAEMILKGLGLHYRAMLLVTGDMSFAAAKTVDIEVWLPGQDRYYEVSSVSNCTDYQARRSKIRYRDNNRKNELIHTLNGSGLATSRLMVALIENNQTADGRVVIPEVLRPYLGGIEVIG